MAASGLCSLQKRALRQDLHPVDLLPDQPWVLVKDADQAEALGLKGEVLDQRHAQVARTQQDDLQPAVEPQDVADLLVQRVHIVAVALLAKTAKAVEILADLRRGEVHQLRQLARRDSVNILLQQVI